MKISHYINEGNVALNVAVSNKNDLLDLMINEIARDAAVKGNSSITFTEIEEAIYTREQQASTGLGDGYAFPHARLKDLDDIVVYVVTLKEGIDYISFDGKPVTTACMILAPEDRPTLALKFMSELVKVLSQKDAQSVLSQTTQISDFIEFFRKEERHIEHTIRASDIMRPPYTSFTPETPLKKITHLMSVYRVNAVAIINEDKKVIGQITCDLLFNYGVPEFFQSLKSVSFIDEFDPFAEYFSKEANAVASDIMTTNFSTMPQTATLLEIVFALTVQKFPQLYVVENEELVGIIDQSTVLDRIVNF